MIDAVSSRSPYENLQPYGGSAPIEGQQKQPPQLDLPPEPGPLEQLRLALNEADGDSLELSARSSQLLAAKDGQQPVSDSGVADVPATTETIAERRTLAATSKITAQFGAEASQFVSANGDIDRTGLQNFLVSQDRDATLPPDEELYDLRPDIAYGPNAENIKAGATSFLDVRA